MIEYSVLLADYVGQVNDTDASLYRMPGGLYFTVGQDGQKNMISRKDAQAIPNLKSRTDPKYR